MLLNGSQSVTDEMLDRYATSFREMLKSRLQGPREARKGTLRMSNVGRPCERQLYYEVNHKEEAEPLRPEAHLKFLYGDCIELLMLFLCEAAGHTVEGTQDEQEIEGIKGHRDAVIDGTVVDVKSASTYSFRKFSEGKLEEDDPFGYVDQLQSYLYSGQDDPKVTDKTRGAFLVVDKTLGHICLDFHETQDIDYSRIYRYKKSMVNSDRTPERGYDPVPDGKSGNEKLGVSCSYCSFSKKCWPQGRTFLYSSGPTTLVTVKREPNVPELKS